MTPRYNVVGIDMPCMDLNVNVPRFPRPGVGERVRRLSWQGGGKVATGLAACARLGVRDCAVLGSVGGDLYGRFILGDFARHGVDARGMTVHPAAVTSLSIVLSDEETRNRTFVFHHGTAPLYRDEDLPADILRDTRYLFVCHANAAVARAIGLARAAGARVLMDADGYSPAMEKLIPETDVWVGSEAFYQGMFGRGDADADMVRADCMAVREKGPGIVAFTFGEKGCMGLSGEGFFALPAFDVEAADTVGAGDVFHGGFLAGLLEGMDAKEAARLASAAAAVKCTRIGGRAGIPDRATAARFLQDSYIDYTDIDERVRFYERGLEHV